MSSNELPLHARSCTYFDVLHRLKLDGDLAGDLAERWQAHLLACASCRSRASEERALFEAFPAGPSLADSRHEEILASVLAQGQAVPEQSQRSGLGRGWISALLAAASLAGILLGFGFGRFAEVGTSSEVAGKLEVDRDLRQQLTLAKLRDPLASRRLTAVLEIEHEPKPDGGVLSAVLWHLQYDPSVNVRLTAIRVLTGQLERPRVLEEIVASLHGPPDPLVRLAMIDALSEVDSRASQTLLRALRDSPNVSPMVRELAGDRLNRPPQRKPLPQSKSS